MPKRLNFHLSDDEVVDIERVLRQDKRPEVRQRATAVYLLHLGHRPTAVAVKLSLAVPTIYKWYHRYRQEGSCSLADRPPGSFKRKADAAYLQALVHAVAHGPRALGYDFAVWTVKRLRDHLTQVTGVYLSNFWLHILLRQHNLDYRRPKHDQAGLQDITALSQAMLKEAKGE